MTNLRREDVMTTREELRALAERVMALTGSDREVDALVWRATVPDAQHWPDSAAMLFTASLDAAMTLVPEGLLWTMDSWADGWSAGIWRPQRGWMLTPDKERKSRTPALALTAAALLARAEQVQP